jgi:hypothetical protein
MAGTILLEAPDLASVNNERLAIVLGLITLALALSAFLSCRVCISWLSYLGIKNPTRIKGYSQFYKFHLYYWWAFGVALVAHLMVATLHTGLPQAGDPDAWIHWVILGMGLFSAILAASLFFSCRVFPKLISMAGSIKPFNNLIFRTFYGFHSYLWLILAVSVAVHFTVTYTHAGVWPPG